MAKSQSPGFKMFQMLQTSVVQVPFDAPSANQELQDQLPPQLSKTVTSLKNHS